MDTPPASASRTRPILVTTSVIVAAPSDKEGLHERLMAVAEQLRRVTEQACAADPDCTPTGWASFHYLDDGTENSRLCERCGRWTTDVDQPDRLDALGGGCMIDGRFLCEPCRVHLIDAGESPDPMARRRGQAH